MLALLAGYLAELAQALQRGMPPFRLVIDKNANEVQIVVEAEEMMFVGLPIDRPVDLNRVIDFDTRYSVHIAWMLLHLIHQHDGAPRSEMRATPRDIERDQ